MAEVTLYDPSGEPVVYIDVDDDHTIYTWGGTPVAYLSDEHIYGFNGKHLGWFQDGIVWDHDGNRAGYLAQTLPVYAAYEPYKSYKSYKPYRSYQEYAPYQPYKLHSESRIPLLQFMSQGAS
ncbi:4-fold beta flower protein [Haloferula helveola]|uniref:4-fold beta flower protein n=1 Tax=Haloferula helveola TaxID=490095 RepID=UPI0030A9FD00